MNLTWPSKHPSAELDYTWPVPVEGSDTVTQILETTVVAGSVSIQSASIVANKSIKGIITGGQYGENAVIRLGALTASGLKFFEDFLLVMESAPEVPSAPTGVETAADIAADLTALREARSLLARGERVKEFWRAGRRLIYEGISLKDLDALIVRRENDLVAAQNTAAGRKRRRAMTLGWPN